jgi:hypothetical protein
MVTGDNAHSTTGYQMLTGIRTRRSTPRTRAPSKLTDVHGRVIREILA